MKWFKHDTDASIDAKLQEILLDYGAAGYGLYWYCIELIAKDVTPKNITFELEHDIRIIARNLNLSAKEVQDMMKKMIEIGLFDLSINKKIVCVKLAYRLDDSMRKGRQIGDILANFETENDLVGKIPNKSGKYPLDKEEDKDKDKDKDKEEKKKKANKSRDVILHPSIIADTWNQWVDYRKQRKLTCLIVTLQAQANSLQEMFNKGIDPNKVIEDSIKNGWQGLFEPKLTYQPKQSKLDTSMETYQRVQDMKQQHQQNNNFIDGEIA
jgi:hypothetical protein